ncbi:MAG: SDR family NAD(P)-dependent oxidoreductase [Steroidobacteraceae bacterium]|jgi:NAD(P)-dependent dehydrogenase (short-subunit alcohol dehydrogenase family)|nr:SDR family NAD(P)-dependent oxidoreductase [Steroidobacteraceae bacterium]
MKTAIVTGGAHGLGAAICARAAKAGYRVGVLDLKRDEAQACAAKLEGTGHVGLQADVTNEHQVKAAFDEFGVAPDLVVNNAGIVRFGPLVEHSIDDFRLVVNINLVGTYIVAREAGNRMIPRGSGSIVNLTSLNAVTPGPGAGAYPATKAAVANLTEHLSLELGPLGIRVNCVAPGFIDAGMSAPIYADPKVRALRGGAVPLRSLGSAEDVANAVIWLASDEAAYVTGHQLVVDGGVAHSVLLQLPRKVD